MSTIKKINIAQEAAKLTKPFSMIELAYVDDFTVNAYVCQGTIAWHKHIDQDELFLVHSGVITLESEWGNVILQPNELAVVPKGLTHRSSSFLWSVVLLFHPKFLIDRKNGNRWLFAIKGEKHLEKVNIVAEEDELTVPFSPVDLASVEDFVVRLVICQGTFHWHKHTDQDELFLVQMGDVVLENEISDLTLKTGEMTVVPKGVKHRPVSTERAVIVLFGRESLVPAGD